MSQPFATPAHSRTTSYARSEAAHASLNPINNDQNIGGVDRARVDLGVETDGTAPMKGERDIEEVLDEIGFGRDFNRSRTRSSSRVDGTGVEYRSISAQTACRPFSSCLVSHCD